MEKNTSKNKYDKQDRYNKKTYNYFSVKVRKEWELYKDIKSIAQKKGCSVNSLMIYAIVEELKANGYKPAPELQAFIDNNYKQ